MRIQNVICLGLLCLAGMALCGDLDGDRRTDKLFEKWRWRVFTPGNGLPDRNFSMIMQARNTLYYAAGGRRVYFYDGYEWAVLPFPKGQGPAQDILALVEGREGLIFAATRKGIWAFQLGSGFQKIHEGDHIVLSASPEREVFFMDKGRLHRMIGTQVHMLQNVDPVPAKNIFALAVDATEIIWVGTDKGLFRQEAYGWSRDSALAGLGPAETPCRGLFMTSDLSLWANIRGTDHSWILLRRQNGQWRRTGEGAPEVPVLHVAGFADGVTYAFTEEGGLYRWKAMAASWERFHRIRPGSPVIASGIVDNRQALWLCFRAIGIARFNARSGRWKRMPLDIAQPGNRVLSLLYSRDGTLWAGTQQGLYRSAGERALTPVLDIMGISLERITGIAEDRDGRIWVVSPTAFAGAFVYADGRWTRRRLQAPYEDVAFAKVTVDSEDRVWLMAAADDALGGVWLLDQNVPRHFGRAEGLPGQQVSDVLLAKDNRIWFATEGGLARLDNTAGFDSWYYLSSQVGGLPANSVWDIEEGKDGSIWIVYRSGGGITRWKEGAITHYGSANGLDNENVWSVRCAKNGDLWFGTQTGLSRFDDTAFYNYEVGEDPLLSNVRPVTEAMDQRGMVVGTLASGVFMFSRNDNDPPKVFPLQNPKQFPYDQPVRLSWEGRDRFNETHHDHLLYIVKLDGKQWSSPQMANNFVEKALPPGRHSLEVQVRDLDGNQARFPMKITFFVALSWFQSPLAIVSGIVLIVIFIALLMMANTWRRKARTGSRMLSRLVRGVGLTVVATDARGRIVHVIGPPVPGLLEGDLLQNSGLGRQLSHVPPGGEEVLTREGRSWRVSADEATGGRAGQSGLWRLAAMTRDQRAEPPAQLLAQVEGLAATARPSESRTALSFSALDAVRDMLKTLPEKQQGRIAERVPVPEILWQALGDPQDFKDILRPLFLNALESAPDGEVAYTIQNRRENTQAGPKSYLFIEILDQGRGLSGDAWAVFKPFNTTKDGHDGLGLALALGLAGRQGAMLMLEQNQPAGCRALVYFPAGMG